MGLEDVINIKKMDYHSLGGFGDKEFDGVYTMETFVHATEPEVAAREFWRILKPGGKLVMRVSVFFTIFLDSSPKLLDLFN